MLRSGRYLSPAVVVLAVAGVLAVPRGGPCQDLVISEFLAANENGLVDSDGDTSDWFEVHNAGTAAIDVGGYFVTDDPGRLDKFRLPSVVIESGGFLLVFASGKDRTDDPAEIHAGFRLDASGEYLALVAPDGATIVHEYAPAYPRQLADVSYGIGQDVEIDPLIPEGTRVRVLAPADGSIGTTWTGGDEPFDDSSWTEGDPAVGYVTSVEGFAVWNFKANVSVGSLAVAEQVIAEPAMQVDVEPENAAVIDYLGTAGGGHYSRDNPFPGTLAGDNVDDFVIEARAVVTIPSAGPWTFGVRSDDGFGLDLTRGAASFRIEHPTPRGPGDTVGVFNVPAAGDYELRLVFYERGGGSELELFAAAGSHGGWNGSFRLVGDVAAGGLPVRSDVVAGGPTGSFRDLIGTDVEAAMHGVSASAYVRIPFAVADPVGHESLTLRALHDDGFVAYLNGVEVARRNAPASPRHDSRATADRPAHLGRIFDDVDVSKHLSTLRTGANVLALHGLNDAPDGGDFLIHAELAEVRIVPLATGYFETPTPGAPNDAAFLDIVADTKFSVDRGFHDEPFDVEITTATPGAVIRYTLDGSEPTVADGLRYEGALHIDRTTVLRAAAFKTGFVPTNVDTHTYLFLDDIVFQDYQATLDAGFPPTWGGTDPDYGIDPRVIGPNDDFGGKYAAQIDESLLLLPTMSIVMNIDDMFGTRGIYTNSTSRGVAWERPCSVELIHPDGSEGFQVDCGIRIQGGAFRSHGLTKKHSLRLLFKEIHGPTKLRYPLFGPGASDRLDTVTLRAQANDHWFWTGGNAVFVRDSFGRETVLDIGGASSHETWVHLYINGIYWGLYNPVERPDHSFSATYFGDGETDSDDKDDWDAISNSSATNGSTSAWNTLVSMLKGDVSDDAVYEAAQGNFADGSDDPARESYVDVDNLIDYMITNLWVGNTDWPGKNWWIGRSRVRSTGFKFYMWDAEWSIGINSGLDTNRTGVSNGVAEPYGLLRANAEFRLRFADRAHRVFFDGGALAVDPSAPQWDPEHPERNAPAARFMRICEAVDRAIVAESARWGDHKRAAPMTRDEHWEPARDALLRDYFPYRTARVLAQFRGAGLYPQVNAPVFSQHGGRLADGFVLLMTTTSGTIYYTLDGSDPRLRGGAIAPGAREAGTAASFTLIESGAGARVHVPADGSLGLDWTAVDFDDSGWTEGTTGVGYERSAGYEGLIATDVESAMYNTVPSVYVRVPFLVDDPGAFAFFNLRMMYDDGFVAYLNGERIAARNAPADVPAWNAAATGSHDDSSAVVFESIDIADAVGFLRRGVNVLAIHGLNVSTGSSDMLILPELAASEVSGSGIPLAGTTTVRARSLLGGEWSALNEATFVEDLSALRITELMYHPPSPGPDSPFSTEDFEFIELQNTGVRPLSLAGVRFAAGVEFAFPERVPDAPVLPAGEYMVLLKDLEAFASRYDAAGILIGGEYDGQLRNGGELIFLVDALGEPLMDFVYSDSWYPMTDGRGASLVVADATLPPGAWQTQFNWLPSSSPGGSPGYPDGGGPPGGWQVPGDSNQDGVLDVSDAVSMLVRLFDGARLALPCDGESLTEGGNRLLLDVNGDAGVNIADVVFTLNHLFKSGARPALGVECVRIEGCPSRCFP